ncbi:unnamed protein product [Spirodela intermedia]|uniref:Uncharacterized protein n=2 Tax=Spirodela intermedia TaxID=51605 RepID=A0A7I8IX75_SPIIN|nr:unnamed protein product [Spirodela intermedia]CAA6661600.1 unnamed protein product [Spirodela intermedia]CAA7397977.1 unnamed protein product [Spirodela intermedia]
MTLIFKHNNKCTSSFWCHY